MADHLPLRIEWALATPWCPPPHGLHLDGLIAWALVQEMTEEERLPPTFAEAIAELPFDRYSCSQGWVWKASMVRPVEVKGSERRYMTAKTAAYEFAERMHDGRIEGKPLTTVDMVRGPYKNDAFWYTVEHVDRCVAYCIGDPERIVPLLERVTHLGKRMRLDHGRVAPVDGMLATVVEDEAALTRWRQRNMPAPDNGHQPVMGRLQPPYWQGEGATMVWRPL